MPEHESQAPATAGGVAGGYPPMTPLRGAVPGWAVDRPLTGAVTPEAARAVLRAEAETSVIHPVGLRWLLVRRVGRAVQVLAWLWLVVVLIRSASDDGGSGVSTAPLAVLLSALLLTGLVPWAWLRAEPPSGSRRSRMAAGWRLATAAGRGESRAAPPAAWPEGAEAYAVLSTVDGTGGIDGPWLLDRCALPGRVGAAWLSSLTRLGWLVGGGTTLGSPWRSPWRITHAGRERLAAERRRLEALAGADRPDP